MLFDFSNVQSEEELFKKLDEIRAEVMFKNREECLRIIKDTVYTYGVNQGRVKAEVFDYELQEYDLKFDDETLKQLAAWCLYINYCPDYTHKYNKLSLKSP